MMTLTIVHSDLYLQTFPNSVVKWNICVSFRFRVREIDTVRKVSKYGVFSGPYFPAFGLNTGKYGPEKTPYLNTFHAVREIQKILHASYLQVCHSGQYISSTTLFGFRFISEE